MGAEDSGPVQNGSVRRGRTLRRRQKKMTSPAELSRFLAELGDRRERLLQLVDPDDGDRAALLKELTELSEQLIVADEELRFQQEELAAAQQQVRSVAHQR